MEKRMKQKPFFKIILGVLLLFTGLNVWGQEKTAPIPPPDRDASIIPSPLEPPEEESSGRGQQRTRTQTPGSGQAAGGQQQARTQTPAAQPRAPAQPSAPAQSRAPAQPQTPAAGGGQQRAPAQERAQKPPAVNLMPDKGLFWGGMIALGKLNPKIDNGDFGEAYGAMAIAGGLFMGYDFGLFTGQVEFLFANDGGEVRIGNYNYGSNYAHYDLSGTVFQIPLVVKMDLHLRRLLLQPLGGFYLNFGLGDLKDKNGYYQDTFATANPLFGWTLGGTLGFRLRRSFIFWEFRYMSNFGYTELEGEDWFRRAAVLSNFGFQYYFKSKKSTTSR
jgi:hypothetical protein